jgi:hypothetical protein
VHPRRIREPSGVDSPRSCNTRLGSAHSGDGYPRTRSAHSPKREPKLPCFSDHPRQSRRSLPPGSGTSEVLFCKQAFPRSGSPTAPRPLHPCRSGFHNENVLPRTRARANVRRRADSAAPTPTAALPPTKFRACASDAATPTIDDPFRVKYTRAPSGTRRDTQESARGASQLCRHGVRRCGPKIGDTGPVSISRIRDGLVQLGDQLGKTSNPGHGCEGVWKRPPCSLGRYTMPGQSSPPGSRQPASVDRDDGPHHTTQMSRGAAT